MDRHLVISSDCHAGLPPERYRDYLDPQHRATFDAALPIQTQMLQQASEKFLVADINREWRRGREADLAGAWDHEARLRVLDGDGIAAEVIFPDGITEMNTPPFGAGLCHLGQANRFAPLGDNRRLNGQFVPLIGRERARQIERFSRRIVDDFGDHGRAGLAPDSRDYRQAQRRSRGDGPPGGATSMLGHSNSLE